MNCSIYKGCAKDEVPQVRRTAASTLKMLLEFSPQFPESEALSMFQDFNKDEQDSVRLMSIGNLLALRKTMSLSDDMMKEGIKTWAEDKSWRIRYMVAEKMCELSKVLDKEYLDTILIEYFQKFMKDDEAEVRAISAAKLGDFLALLDTESQQKLFIGFKALSTDSQSHIRRILFFELIKGSLAEKLGTIPQGLSAEHVKNNFLPIVSSLLADSNAEIRAITLATLEDLSKKVDKEEFSKMITQTLDKLQADKSWRIRSAAIDTFITHLKVLGEKEFIKKLGKCCERWLEDPVYEVRKSGIGAIRKLIPELGYEWAKEGAIKKLLELEKHKNYLYRSVPLMAFQELVEVAPKEEVKEVYVPRIFELAKDKVANIRITAVKSLVALKKLKDEEVNRRVTGILLDMEKDSDIDVRNEAIKFNNNDL